MFSSLDIISCCLELNLCVHRSLRSSSGFPIHLRTGWLDPLLSPRSSFRPFLVMPWRGILCPGATSFLSFLSLYQSKTEKRQPLSPTLVWNECLTQSRTFSFFQKKTRVFWLTFSVFSHLRQLMICNGPSLVTTLNFLLMVSAQRKSTIPPLDELHFLSASKLVPRVNNRVFV